MTFFSYFYIAEVAAVFILFFVRMWLIRKRTGKTNVRMVIYQDADILLEPNMIKKFSLATASIVVSLLGISAAGATALLDGALSVVSSDDSVMTVTPIEGGLFRIYFVGAGQASLLVAGDAELRDGVRTLSQEYPFEIYDQSAEADHIDLTIVEVHPRMPIADTVDDAHAEAAGDESTTS
ncbi:MAG: hypothetical protein ACXWAT_16110 [Methylobacter sp.]